jgi:hypothetical protein
MNYKQKQKDFADRAKLTTLVWPTDTMGTYNKGISNSKATKYWIKEMIKRDRRAAKRQPISKPGPQ